MKLRTKPLRSRMTAQTRLESSRIPPQTPPRRRRNKFTREHALKAKGVRKRAPFCFASKVGGFADRRNPLKPQSPPLLDPCSEKRWLIAFASKAKTIKDEKRSSLALAVLACNLAAYFL